MLLSAVTSQTPVCSSFVPPEESPGPNGATLLFTCTCRGCIFQVLPDLNPQHQARSSAQYWQLRSAWPQQQAVAAFLQSPPLVALLQAVLASSQVLLYNGKQAAPAQVHGIEAFLERT